MSDVSSDSSDFEFMEDEDFDVGPETKHSGESITHLFFAILIIYLLTCGIRLFTEINFVGYSKPLNNETNSDLYPLNKLRVLVKRKNGLKMLLDVADGRRKVKDYGYVDAQTSKYLQSATQNLQEKYNKIKAKIKLQILIRQEIVNKNIQKDLPILKNQAMINSFTFLVLSFTTLFSVLMFCDYSKLNSIQILYLGFPVLSLLLVSALSFKDLYDIVYFQEELIDIGIIRSLNVFKFILSHY